MLGHYNIYLYGQRPHTGLSRYSRVWLPERNRLSSAWGL